MKNLVFISVILFFYGILSSSMVRTEGIVEVLTMEPWTSLQVWEDTTNAGSNYIQTYYDCIEDNDWYFSQDSTLLMLEDSLKCITGFPEGDTLHFSWELRLNGDVLCLKSDFDEEEMIYEILNASNDSLVLLKVEDQYIGNHIYEKLILKR